MEEVTTLYMSAYIVGIVMFVVLTIAISLIYFFTKDESHEGENINYLGEEPPKNRFKKND